MQQAMQGKHTRRVFLAAILAISVVFFMRGIAGKAQTADDEKKINDTIAKMTLEEKIQMLSGSSMMASTPLARLGIPSFAFFLVKAGKPQTSSGICSRPPVFSPLRPGILEH